MGYMMYVFASVARVNSDDFSTRSCLELLRPRGSDEDLRRRDKAREIDEVAQGCNLSDGLNGTFSQDGEEAFEADRGQWSALNPPCEVGNPCSPTMSSWKPWLLEVYDCIKRILIQLARPAVLQQITDGSIQFDDEKRGSGREYHMKKDSSNSILIKRLPTSTTNTATPQSPVIQGETPLGKFDFPSFKSAAAKPLSLPRCTFGQRKKEIV